MESHKYLLLIALSLLLPILAHAQTFNEMDESGNITQRNENQNFNPHNRDTTQQKTVPKGIYVWTVDRRFGDIHKTDVDTMPHLYPQSTMAPGMYGDYNTTGSNYTARLSRIFANRKAIKGKYITVKIADNLTGVVSYSCYINGEWQLAEHDGKTATLSVSTEPMRRGNNRVTFRLEDAVGNVTEQTWTIIKN